jgi:hypothetical protein
MAFARVLGERVPEQPAVLRARWRDAMNAERARFAAQAQAQAQTQHSSTKQLARKDLVPTDS